MTRIVHYASTNSPFGLLWVAASDRGVVMLSYDVDEAAFCHELDMAGYEPEYDPAEVQHVLTQIDEFFDGTRTVFTVPVDLGGLPPFGKAVLGAVAAVPFGEVRSYGEIAAMVGRPRAARAVGTVLAGNRVSFLIPCHRIIRSDGTLGEYGGRAGGRSATSVKRALLRREGVDL